MTYETTPLESAEPATVPAEGEPAPEPAQVIVEQEWEDGAPYDPNEPDRDPYAETRLPEDCGPPYPAGLLDPLSPDLIDSARYLLVFLLNIFRSPKLIASSAQTWQSRKFQLLDWLRPLELLLRRLLLVEALSLLVSQALPPRNLRAGKDAAAAKAQTKAATRRAPLSCDPDRPETWNVSFQVIPCAPRPGRRRYPANPNLPPLKSYFCCDELKARDRRVLHPTLPLARRLEAVIRVVVNPAPFARRLAFRLRARANPNAELLLVDHHRSRRPMLTDALQSARDRAAELFCPVWEMFWSSA